MTKISDLTAVSTAAKTDRIAVVQSGDEDVITKSAQIGDYTKLLTPSHYTEYDIAATGGDYANLKEFFTANADAVSNSVFILRLWGRITESEDVDFVFTNRRSFVVVFIQEDSYWQCVQNGSAETAVSNCAIHFVGSNSGIHPLSADLACWNWDATLGDYGEMRFIRCYLNGGAFSTENFTISGQSSALVFEYCEMSRDATTTVNIYSASSTGRLQALHSHLDSTNIYIDTISASYSGALLLSHSYAKSLKSTGAQDLNTYSTNIASVQHCSFDTKDATVTLRTGNHSNIVAGVTSPAP